MRALIVAFLALLPSLTLACSPLPGVKRMSIEEQWDAAQFVILGTIVVQEKKVQLDLGCIFKAPSAELKNLTALKTIDIEGMATSGAVRDSCQFEAEHNKTAVVYLQRQNDTGKLAVQMMLSSTNKDGVLYDVGDLKWVPSKYNEQAVGKQCPGAKNTSRCPSISTLKIKNLNGLIKDNTTEYLVAGQLSWNETAAKESVATESKTEPCKSDDCTLKNVFLKVACVMKTPAGVNASQLIGTMQEIQGFLNPFNERNIICDYSLKTIMNKKNQTTPNVVLTLKKTDKGKFVLDKTLTRSAVKVITTPVPKAKLPGQNWKTITGGEKCKAFVEESVWKRPDGTKTTKLTGLVNQFFDWLVKVYLPGEVDLPGVPVSAWDFFSWGLFQ